MTAYPRHPTQLLRNRVSPAAALGIAIWPCAGARTTSATSSRPSWSATSACRLRDRLSSSRRHGRRPVRDPVGVPGHAGLLRARTCGASPPGACARRTSRRSSVAERVRPTCSTTSRSRSARRAIRKVEAQDRLPGRLRLHAQALPGARLRTRAGGRRRRLLPALPGGVHQAAGDAAALQHASHDGAARTTAGSAPTTSSTPACRSSRSPTPATCNVRSATPRAARRGSTYRSLDQIERMLDAVVRNEGEPDVVQISGGEPTIHPDFFAVLDRAKARADPAPDGQHQRHPHRARRGVRAAAGRVHARLRGVPAVRLVRAGGAAGAARRRSPRRARARARAPERARHLDDARRHAEEGAQRRRDRANRRLRARSSRACAA